MPRFNDIHKLVSPAGVASDIQDMELRHECNYETWSMYTAGNKPLRTSMLLIRARNIGTRATQTSCKKDHRT